MYWDVITAVVVSIILGTLWYGPFFGKTWMRLSGMDEKKSSSSKESGMVGSYVWMIIGSLVTVAVLKIVLLEFDVRGVYNASVIASMLWLGFVAPVQLGSVLWEGKPLGLYLVNTSYNLVSSVLSAIILILIN